MKIKKAVNSTTLLIPSVLLNVALVLLSANYVQMVYNRAEQDFGQPIPSYSRQVQAGKKITTAEAPTATSAVPVVNTRPASL